MKNCKLLIIGFLIFFGHLWLYAQDLVNYPQNSSPENKLGIDQKREQIQKIIDRRFEFEDVPDYIAGHKKKIFLQETSIMLLENLVNNFPDSGFYNEALYKLGDYYYTTKNYKKAVPYFEKYVEKMNVEGKSREVRFKLGVSYKKLKKYQSAIISFFKVLDLYGKTDLSYDAYLQIADCYMRQNDIKKLIVTYENVASYFNDIDIICESFIKVAKIYIDNKNYFEGMWVLRKLVTQYKGSKYYFEGLYLLGICYGKIGEHDKEIEMFKEVVSTYSNDNKFGDKAMYSLAESYYLNNEFKEASAAYYTALKRDPENPENANATYNLAMCYLKLGVPDLALENFKKIKSMNIDDEKRKQSFFYIGEIYHNRGEYEKAIETLSKIADKEDINANPHAVYYLGLSYFNLKNYRTAFEYFLSLEHQENDLIRKTEGIYMLGKTLVAIGKFDSSTHYFNLAIDIINRIFANKAKNVDDHGQKKFTDEQEERLKVIEKEILMELAKGYFDKGEFVKSAQKYEILSGITGVSSDQAWVLYKISKCYENVKNFDKSNEFYKRLIAQYPDSEFAKQAVWDLKNIEWKQRHSKFNKN